MVERDQLLDAILEEERASIIEQLRQRALHHHLKPTWMNARLSDRV